MNISTTADSPSPGQARGQDPRVRQAEELLFGGPQKLGFGKGLFFGRFIGDWVMPYPELSPEEAPRVEAAVAEVSRFTDEQLDPVQIDRGADIPRAVINGLGALGVLGMTAPVEFGGKGFSQLAYCRVMELIGAECASTSVFVNAHHSIGMRALLLFGTPEQKRRWLPALVRGQKLAAFALTEPEAGSDAANIQTRATPSGDGSHYILDGQKRYITNGGIADVLTVMARTPGRDERDSAVTAFLVTPDMPGFRVTQERMEKMGIRGTVTSRLAFEHMAVPRENILGPEGKGLRVALTVLDFGRTTFGACCTGAAKTCLRLAVEHARTRRQFGRPLGQFELVKQKIAFMAARIYAMEAMTNVTANLIDRGLEDYMLETAMLKVYCTEALWDIVNDAFQIFGGAAYFTDLPLERMLRDARINQIGEGANDVLRSFIALVGMRGPGEDLRKLWEAMHHPMTELRTVWRYGLQLTREAAQPPEVPVRRDVLRPYARSLGDLVRRFEASVRKTLIRHREDVLDRQYPQARIADAAMELFASACALSRLDAECPPEAGPEILADPGLAAPLLLLESSARTVRRRLSELTDNDDGLVTAAADLHLVGDSPGPTP